MRSSGFTLIELLVVISIIGILSVMGYANYRDFAANQIAKKAVGQIQTYLRLAQSNATTSTLCNGEGATSWSLKFADPSNIELHCNSSSALKTLNLENATVAITGEGNCTIDIPVILSYKVGSGAQNFSVDNTNTTLSSCLGSSTFTFKVTNIKNPSASPVPFNITKGVEIDVK